MRLTDPQKFTIISAAIILCVSIATGYTASTFYRHAMTTRSLVASQEFVQSNVHEQEAEGSLSSRDLENYTDNASQQHLAHSFTFMTKTPGFAGMKVFNRDKTIVWSPAAELVGTNQSHHLEAVARALSDGAPAAFNPSSPTANDKTLMEFYLPFRLGGEHGAIGGVVSIYRSSASINSAIQESVYLLWLVTGFGGFILYVALYRLFLAVYHERDEINSRLMKFSSEHERLIQSEKLAAMGQMVTEIAHQLNNPLVGVINLTELSEREIGDQVRVKQLLGEVRNAGERCREFVQRVLQIGQLTRSEWQVTDLSQLVRDSVAFFQQSLGQHQVVNLKIPAERLTCAVDSALMRNALFNLIHNAAQADQYGPIIVSLAREQRDGKLGFSISVLDRGPGIPPGAADKLFKPFFTTRSGGTGLGLSIAQQIAVLHGGTITFENRPDGGAQFTIWIPANRDET